MRRIVALALLALLGLLLQARAPVAALDPVRAVAELVALTNLNRTANGLAALPTDQDLGLVATSRSEDMIKRGYFSHQIPPDNHTVVDLLESLGVLFRSGGENIEWNSAAEFSSVQYASNDFMNSPSHRANILNRRYNKVGAGVSEGSGRRMYTVVFVEQPPEAPKAPTAPAASQVPPTSGGASAQSTEGQPAPPQAPGTPPDAATRAAQTPVTSSDTSPAPTEPTAVPVSGPSPATSVAAPASAPPKAIRAREARLSILESIVSRLLRIFLNL